MVTDRLWSAAAAVPLAAAAVAGAVAAAVGCAGAATAGVTDAMVRSDPIVKAGMRWFICDISGVIEWRLTTFKTHADGETG